MKNFDCLLEEVVADVSLSGNKSECKDEVLCAYNSDFSNASEGKRPGQPPVKLQMIAWDQR